MNHLFQKPSTTQPFLDNWSWLSLIAKLQIQGSLTKWVCNIFDLYCGESVLLAIREWKVIRETINAVCHNLLKTKSKLRLREMKTNHIISFLKSGLSISKVLSSHITISPSTVLIITANVGKNKCVCLACTKQN